MDTEQATVPFGYCHCGCGERTQIAARTHTSKGIVKGEPLRYVRGHSGGTPRREPVAPRLCECGCGEATTIHNGVVRRFVGRHGSYHRGPRWRDEARGYGSPCWVWLLAKDRDGYGTATVNGRFTRAHRVVYEQMVGPIPDGLQLDHLCRQPDCVNPQHLEPVTGAENSRRGSNTKLTREAADAIRRETAAGAPQRDVAKRYGIRQSTVSKIVLGQRWQ